MKKALNKLEVDAICEVCSQQFPTDRREPKIYTDKNVKNVMDKKSWKKRSKQF